ncbi:hypothetical protein EVAR_43449_1 [Eumeta japonica]|uniref:Uncharacterized protein n=1 Tax=Eumeta variegata TaxID=151549 RepID=A0A4C1YBK9_EUMVA|nr:hypothetical protein EVAR_43449_1 [Eumeta japonica]
MKVDRKEYRKEIFNLSKKIRKNIRRDRKTRRMKTLENYISRAGGTKKPFKELREHNKEWMPKYHRTSSRCNIQDIATNNFRLLYKEPSQPKEEVVPKGWH